MTIIEMNVLEKLNLYSQENSLCGDIARNLLHNAKNEEHLRLKYIAHLSNCSISAVFKFVKNQLQLNSFHQLRFLSDPTLCKSDEQIIDDLELQLLVRNLTKVNKIADYNLINKIVQKINCWNNTWIVGKGSTFYLAEDLTWKLRRIDIPAHSVRAEMQLDTTKMLMRPNEGLILFSISGTSPELIEIAKHAKEIGMKIIIFTSKKDSLLTKAAPALVVPLPKEALIITDILLTIKQYYLFVIDKIINQIIIQNHQKRDKIRWDF